jgi:hypothetical protein
MRSIVPLGQNRVLTTIWESSDRNHQSGTISGVAAVYQRHEFLAERQAALHDRRMDLKIVA